MTEQTISPTDAAKGRGAASSLVLDAVVIMLISIVISACMVRFGSPFLAPQTERQAVAIVNFEQLVQEYIMGMSEQVSSGAIPVSEMSAKSSAFTKELQQRLRVYAESGTTVLRSDVVIVAPDDVADITDVLRSDLVAAGYLPKVPVKSPQTPTR